LSASIKELIKTSARSFSWTKNKRTEEEWKKHGQEIKAQKAS